MKLSMAWERPLLRRDSVDRSTPPRIDGICQTVLKGHYALFIVIASYCYGMKKKWTHLCGEPFFFLPPLMAFRFCLITSEYGKLQLI
ncbi:hypothetical protein TNCV_3925801 [Trichonephila clavipes]|nr:hypothetical protein TNCV_3925801 [Trichonephila clavipes]